MDSGVRVQTTGALSAAVIGAGADAVERRREIADITALANEVLDHSQGLNRRVEEIANRLLGSEVSEKAAGNPPKPVMAQLPELRDVLEQALSTLRVMQDNVTRLDGI